MKQYRQSHIGLVTNNLEATVDFYKNTLGFKVEGSFETSDGIRASFLKSGDVLFEIFQPLEKLPKVLEGKIDHYAFTSNDIEDDYRECIGSGCSVVSKGIESIPEFWENGIRYFIIESPTMEKIEFCQIL